jgi:glyoxylate/succinic semialdehyde reductase
MGKASFHFGEVGKGSQVKLIVNMVMGTMMSAFGEGLALAEANDLPTEKIIEVFGLGAMANPMFAGKGPNMVAGNYAPHFPLKHAQKDIRFALALADQLGVGMPTTAAANEQFKRAKIDHGDEDFSAVYEACKK